MFVTEMDKIAPRFLAPPSVTAHAYATLVRALQSASLQHSDMRVMLRHLLVEQKETDLCEKRRREHWRREARDDFVHLWFVKLDDNKKKR
jgi:hypothetical protein